MDPVLLLSIPVIGIGVWGAISPHSQWRALSARARRRDEAGGTGAAAYRLTRVGNVALLVLVAVALAAAWRPESGDGGTGPGVDQVDQEARDRAEQTVADEAPIRFVRGERDSRYLLVGYSTADTPACEVAVWVSERPGRVVLGTSRYEQFPDACTVRPRTGYERIALERPLGPRRVVGPRLDGLTGSIVLDELTDRRSADDDRPGDPS